MRVGPSAELLVGLLMRLVHPSSVVDVGCGPGTFLRSFRDQGVDELLGLDGPPAGAGFLLDPGQFREVDLRGRVDLDRRFDLALCLEVGEHLPESSSSTLVDTLVAAAPVVAFSAAWPGQGGMGHQNERWLSWWHRLFSDKGYVMLDVVRGSLMSDSEVLDCYRTNTVLFVERSDAKALLDRAVALDVPDGMAVMHRDGATVDLLHQPASVLLRTLATKIHRRIGWRP